MKVTLLELAQEKSTSWDSEQKSSELKKENAILEKKLEMANAELESAKKSLTQEQLVSQGIKEELDKAIKLKEQIEEDLKEPLLESSPGNKSKK